MKRTVLILMTAIMLLSAVACGEATPSGTSALLPTPQRAETVEDFEVVTTKYRYKDGYAFAVRLENNSNEDKSITVTGQCTKDGECVEVITKEFVGFCSGWSNYMIFAPQKQADDITVSITARDCTDAEAMSEYLFVGDKSQLQKSPTLSDDKGTFLYAPEEGSDFYVSVWLACGPIYSTYPERISFRLECAMVIGDEIVDIRTSGLFGNFNKREDSPFTHTVLVEVTDVLAEKINKYKIPEKYDGMTGIVSVLMVTG